MSFAKCGVIVLWILGGLSINRGEETSSEIILQPQTTLDHSESIATSPPSPTITSSSPNSSYSNTDSLLVLSSTTQSSLTSLGPTRPPSTTQTMGNAADYFTLSKSTPFRPETSSPPTNPDTEECPSLEGNMDGLTQEQFTQRLMHSCRYDKVVMPRGHVPLNVSVQMDVNHIEAVDQLQFKTHMLVQYRFMDRRLAYDQISPKRSVMVGEEPLRKKIWIPHIVIKNEKDTAIMGLEGKDMFVAIYPDGEIIFNYRMTATIYCWMDLKKFPFDSQTCEIQFMSWMYNSSSLLLKWEDENPVKVAKQLHLTEFTLKEHKAFEALSKVSLSRSAFFGNYSVVVFQFVLNREIGYYLMDYYIPSIMLVCTSWVTFWLQADASAPRVTLGTSTMLTFITLSSGQTKQLPKVSYIKASEIWFLGITVFIFASMSEFAFVNIIWRRKKKVELKKKSSKYILKSTLTPSLARKQLQRSSSMSSLQKSRSCSSLDANVSLQNSKGYNNYLTVHSFPSANIPTITTQSADELIPRSANNQNDTAVDMSEADSEPSAPHTWTTMTPQEIAIWIDKRSRIYFPCAFLIFNVLYWSFVYAL